MRVAVPREVKVHEYRVAITPAGVREFVRAGHQVLVETAAGIGSGFSDAAYIEAGANIVPTAADAWLDADLVLKVKEPIASEYQFLRPGLTLFAYLHLAADRDLTEALLDSRTTGIAYETVTSADGSLPLLAPMSEVAGRLAPQVGANTLMKVNGGMGVLLGGVPGVRPAKVVVLGGGVAGLNAAIVARGLGADVHVLDISVSRLRAIDAAYRGDIRTITSSAMTVERELADADLVIGAVLVAGAKAPTLVSNVAVAGMRAGSVLVDISVDQGGCFEDSRPTTHADPTFTVHDSVFYCVANMPGAVPNTSTWALTNATLPYALALASDGWQSALYRNAGLATGLNTHDGMLTNEGVAAATGLPSFAVDHVLSA